MADLGYENATGFSIIKNLKTNDWLDRQTRAVIVEFSAFNPSVNVLAIATYFYEVGASGHTATFKRIDVLSLPSTQTAAKQLYMICVLLFVIFVLWYLGREGYKLYKRGFRYFKSFWNWIELCQVVFLLASFYYACGTIGKSVFGCQKITRKRVWSCEFPRRSGLARGR